MAKQPTRPKFYWDGGYLSELETRLGDECIFLCLSPVSFRMLTDMSAMLLWATRYQEGMVPEVGRIAHRELNVPCLQDLYSRLEAIELNNSDWLQSKFDDLGSRMTELEEMDINVTQTVGGGCGCGCGGDTTSTTQTTSGGVIIDPEDTGIIPPYMTEAIIVSDPIKCRSANYLAAKVISTIRTIGQIGDTGGTVAAILFAITFAITWLSPIPGDEIIATSILFRWALSLIGLGESLDFTFEYFSDLANLMEEREEEFVCILYDYNTSSELGSSLSGWIENTVEDLRVQAGMPDIGANMMSSVLVDIFGPNVVNWFVDHVETIVPADFISKYSCLCGATGDSCPTSNLVLAGVGTLPSGDLTGTTQGFGSSFNSQTGYYEIIFELAANYCVTIDNVTYTPTEEHEKCSGGVMVASDGSCIRRFVARSQSPFGTAVEFVEQTPDCNCSGIPADTSDVMIIPIPLSTPSGDLVGSVDGDGYTATFIVNKANGNFGTNGGIVKDYSGIPADFRLRGLWFEIVSGNHSTPDSYWAFMDVDGNGKNLEADYVDTHTMTATGVFGTLLDDLFAAADYTHSGQTDFYSGNFGLMSYANVNDGSPRVGSITFRLYGIAVRDGV